MQPRIEWSDDGTQLLTCLGGAVHRHDVADGTHAIVANGDMLDARWRGTGIAAVDVRGVVRCYERDSVTENDAGTAGTMATIAATSDHYAVLSAGDFAAIELYSFDGKRVWRLISYEAGLGAERITSVALSGDSRHVAVGYEQRGTANYAGEHTEGRGWIVVDRQRDVVIARGFVRVQRAPIPQQLVFDRAGRRLAMAIPERVQSWSPFRIGRDERYPRELPGEARAVALDDRGIIAAYAHAARRIRVDYLEPGAKGPARIAILDTLWIEMAIEAVALAFDRKSRRIAGVDAAGAVDVVPVP